MSTPLATVSFNDDFFEKLSALFRQIVREELQLSKGKEMDEKFLSPKEACNLFYPAISRQTLDALAKQGMFPKHHMGGKVFFKYSEVLNSSKTHKKYQSKKKDLIR